MKNLLALISVLSISIILVSGDDKYTTKYDNMDFDEILQSERLLKNYLNCLMDRGNCTPEGSELKRNLPDALQTECAKCSDAQKSGTKKVIHYLIKNRREWWDELATKYDPEGVYKKRYDEQIKQEGLDI